MPRRLAYPLDAGSLIYTSTSRAKTPQADRYQRWRLVNTGGRCCLTGHCWSLGARAGLQAAASCAGMD